KMPEICALDEDNCLSLDAILRAFHCGTKEEQTWALIHQSIAALKEELIQTNDNYSFLKPNTLYIKNNGKVDVKSWRDISTEKPQPVCRERMIDSTDISEHYRQVCRALVAEAIEMSTFLNQITIGTQELKKSHRIDNEEVENIHVEVWAHLWMKVMRQLRVDFIRSRPPLKPVAERQLNPLPPTEPTLHQKLMDGIKSTPPLRPSPRPFERKFDSLHLPRGKRYTAFNDTNHSTEDTPTANVFKRLSLCSDESNDESIETMGTNTPYLAISMQLETSAREIHDRFEELDENYQNVSEADLQESTSVALHLCKRKVLKPYFRLLALLGWRPLIYPIAPQVTCTAKIFNAIYLSLVILFLVVGYVMQYASCFRQDGYPPYRNQTTDQLITKSDKWLAPSSPMPHFFTNTYENRSANRLKLSATSYTYSDRNSGNAVKCSGNFISLYLIPDLLHFFAYIFVFYLMRTPECEILQNLLERAFLQSTRINGWFIAQKKLVHNLRTFLWMSVTWVAVSLIGHTIHITLFQEMCFTWMDTDNQTLIRIMTAFTILSLTWNDIICAAIVTSYSVHCQLNISYICNLVSAVREKRIDFQEFSKRSGESRKFVEYLNSEQALGVSLLIINFGCRAVVAVFGLLSQQIVVTNDVKIAAMVLISSLLWLSLLSVPIVQAVRLTNCCQGLRRIGHELRSRPFGYQDTPQEDLDSLLLFTSNIRMEAKMINIPIRASGVVSILVIILFCILFLGQINFVKF
ncbi:unnamed protein product, partial [Medioppia subpectinata]